MIDVIILVGQTYLHNNSLQAAHVRVPRHVALHVPAGCAHRDQNARVRSNNHTARNDVAQDEQRHGVGAGRRVLIGKAPVDATGGAVRLRSVFPPVGQRAAGKQQRVEPRAANQQAAVSPVKPVPCQKKDSGTTTL